MNKIKFIGVLVSLFVAANPSFVFAAPKEVRKEEKEKDKDQKNKEEKKKEEKKKENPNKIVEKKEEKKEENPNKIVEKKEENPNKIVEKKEDEKEEKKEEEKNKNRFKKILIPTEVKEGKRKIYRKQELEQRKKFLELKEAIKEIKPIKEEMGRIYSKQDKEEEEYNNIKYKIIKDYKGIYELINTLNKEIKEIEQTKKINIFNDIINSSSNQEKQSSLENKHIVGVVYFLCSPPENFNITLYLIKDLFYKYFFYDLMLKELEGVLSESETTISSFPKTYIIAPITGKKYFLDFKSEGKSKLLKDRLERFYKNFVGKRDIFVKVCFEVLFWDLFVDIKNLIVKECKNIYCKPPNCPAEQLQAIEYKFRTNKNKIFDKFSRIIMKKLKKIFAGSEDEKDKILQDNFLEHFKTLLLSLKEKIYIDTFISDIQNIKIDIASNVEKICGVFDVEKIPSDFANKIKQKIERVYGSELNIKKEQVEANIIKKSNESKEKVGVISFLFSPKVLNSSKDLNVGIFNFIKDSFYKYFLYELMLYVFKPPMLMEDKEKYEYVPNIYVLSPTSGDKYVINYYKFDYRVNTPSSVISKVSGVIENLDYNYYLYAMFRNAQVKDFIKKKINNLFSDIKNYIVNCFKQNSNKENFEKLRKRFFDNFIIHIIGKMFQKKSDQEEFLKLLPALKKQIDDKTCLEGIKNIKTDVVANDAAAYYDNKKEGIIDGLINNNVALNDKKQSILDSKYNVGVITFLLSPKNIDILLSIKDSNTSLPLKNIYIDVRELIKDFFNQCIFKELMSMALGEKIFLEKTNKFYPNIYFISPITEEKYVLNYWDNDLQETAPFLGDFLKDMEKYCFSCFGDVLKNTEIKDFFDEKIVSLIQSIKSRLKEYVEENIKKKDIAKYQKIDPDAIYNADEDNYKEFCNLKYKIFLKLTKSIDETIKKKEKKNEILECKFLKNIKDFLRALEPELEIEEFIDGIEKIEPDIKSSVYNYMQKKFSDVQGIIDDELKTKLKEINSKPNKTKQEILDSKEKVGVISFLFSPQNSDLGIPELINDFFYKYLFYELMLNAKEQKLLGKETYKSAPNIYVVSPITGEKYVLNYRDGELEGISFFKDSNRRCAFCSSYFIDRLKNSELKDSFDYNIYSLVDYIKLLVNNKYGFRTLEDIIKFNNEIFEKFSKSIIEKIKEIFENDKDKKDKILKYFENFLTIFKDKISIDDCIVGIQNTKIDIASNNGEYKKEFYNNEYDCFNVKDDRIVGKNIYNSYKYYYLFDFRDGISVKSHLTNGAFLSKTILDENGRIKKFDINPITLVKQGEFQKTYKIPQEYFVSITDGSNDLTKDCRIYFFNIIFRINFIKYLNDKLKKNETKSDIALIDLSKVKGPVQLWKTEDSWLLNKNIDADPALFEKHYRFIIFFDIDDSEIFSIPRIEVNDEDNDAFKLFVYRIEQIILNKGIQRQDELRNYLIVKTQKEANEIINNLEKEYIDYYKKGQNYEPIEKEFDIGVPCVKPGKLEEFKKTFTEKVTELNKELNKLKEYFFDKSKNLPTMNKKMHDYFYEKLDSRCNICTESNHFYYTVGGANKQWLFDFVKKNYNENYFKKKDELKQCISFMLKTKKPLNYYVYPYKDKSFKDKSTTSFIDTDIITSFRDKLAIYFLYLYLKQYMDEYLEKNKESGLRYEINIEEEGKEQLSYISFQPDDRYLPYCVHVDIIPFVNISKLGKDDKDRLKNEILKFKEHMKKFITPKKMNGMVEDLKKVSEEGAIDVSSMKKNGKIEKEEIGKFVNKYAKKLGNIPFLKDYIECLLSDSSHSIKMSYFFSKRYVSPLKWIENNIKAFYKLCKIDKESENVYNTKYKDSKNLDYIEFEKQKEKVLKEGLEIVDFFYALEGNYTIQDIYWVDEKNIEKKNNIIIE